MKLLQKIATLLLTLSIAAAVGAGAWWLATNKPVTSKADKAAPAATVARVVREDELNTVKLTAEGAKRLGLSLVPVERKPVRRVRMYGGEVAIPVGRSILVAAPIGGLLKAPVAEVYRVGQAVKAGQPILQLLPLLTPDGRASLSTAQTEADGQGGSAKTQVDITRTALDRTRRLLREGVGSQKLVDEAQAAQELALKGLESASARQKVLAKIVGDIESGTASPIQISAPREGILRAVSALPGQTVHSGAPLFEIVDLSTVWVRVPLPVGDIEEIDRGEPARVGRLSALPGSPMLTATPVAAPPSANPLSSTIDVYYEAPNPNRSLTPGQRLGVTIPLTDARESLTVPWSAVVFDVNGGTWVYEEVGERVYIRRRVVVRHTAGPDAVLASGPAVGASIVALGAQELFGAETGFIK